MVDDVYKAHCFADSDNFLRDSLTTGLCVPASKVHHRDVGWLGGSHDKLRSSVRV